MDGDNAAALRQIRLALQRLLGARLQLGPSEKPQETVKRAKAAATANGDQPATATRSEAKASTG